MTLAVLSLAFALQTHIARPEAFGAAADGKTDDTVALTKAIEAVKSGGTVELAAGKTYLVTAPIRLGMGIKLTGDPDKKPTLKIAVGSSRTGILVANASEAGASNIRFESAKNDLLNIFLVQSSMGITIKDCDFAKNPLKSSGMVRVKDSSAVEVSGCTFTDGYEAIEVFGNSRNVMIAENTITGVRQYGIRVQGTETTFSTDISILKNKVSEMHRIMGQNAGHPIYVHIGEGVGTLKHKNVTVEGNQIKGLNRAYTEGGNADLMEYCDVVGGRVAKNRADYGGDVGIAVIRCKSIVVEDNDAGYNNTNGIVLWETHDSKVLNNRAYNNNQDRLKQWGTRAWKGGIRVMARTGTADNNELAGNKCWDDQRVKTQDYGIYLMKSAKGTKLGRNELSGNRFGPILDESRSAFGGELLGKRSRARLVALGPYGQGR